jgi:methyl-accepting chemotaxis protein
MVSSMDEIARVAAGNAKATQEVVETTGEQLDAMGELVNSTRGVTDLSEELRGVLQRFETGGPEETP